MGLAEVDCNHGRGKGMKLSIHGQCRITAEEADILSELRIDAEVHRECADERGVDPEYRRRYLRKLRRLSGDKTATAHMVTSCAGVTTLNYGEEVST